MDSHEFCRREGIDEKDWNSWSKQQKHKINRICETDYIEKNPYFRQLADSMSLLTLESFIEPKKRKDYYEVELDKTHEAMIRYKKSKK